MTEIPYVLIICVAAVICLTPLAVYLRIIAALGQKERPTVVSGSWDFVGVVAGLSGFLLFGGIMFLVLWSSHFRWGLRGGFAALRTLWDQQAATWSVLAALYLIGVGLWIGIVLLSRWRSWVIYNVDVNSIEQLLVSTLAQQNIVVQQRGRLWYRGNEPVYEVEGPVRGGWALIRWLHSDRVLFEEVDRQIRSQIALLPPVTSNQAVLWLRAAASGLGVFSLTCLGMLVYAFFGLR